MFRDEFGCGGWEASRIWCGRRHSGIGVGHLRRLAVASSFFAHAVVGDQGMHVGVRVYGCVHAC